MTILSLSILVLALGAQIILRLFGHYNIRIIRIINSRISHYVFFICSIVFVFLLLTYYSGQQYMAWQSGELSKFLLPPYQSINYFIGYVGARIFAPYLISLAAAILFLFSARKLNKKYEERFFEAEEPWLGALAIFLAGWPALLFYFIGLILLYLFIHLLLVIGRRLLVKETRLSLYYWWIPLAIIVIIINTYLIRLGIWKLLKV